jgi:hypothetical protein
MKTPNQVDARPRSPSGDHRQAPIGRAGASLVEFALISPVLFFCFFILVEAAHYMMVLHGLEDAAREGCRVAVTLGATQQEVDTAVANRLRTYGITGYTAVTQPSPPTSAEQFDPISVTISVPYREIALLPFLKDLSARPLQSSCTLTKESDEFVP